MRAVARLAEQELRASGDDFFAEGDKSHDEIAQIHQFRAPTRERHGIDAEAGLQSREAVELVQHHITHGVAL